MSDTETEFREAIGFDWHEGNDDDYEADDWRATANGYTVTVTYDGDSAEFSYWMGSGIEHEPRRDEVLDSLQSDYRAGDQSFENFCADFGYDTDSRKAYATWQACCEQVAKLDELFGSDIDQFLDEEWDR